MSTELLTDIRDLLQIISNDLSEIASGMYSQASDVQEVKRVVFGYTEDEKWVDGLDFKLDKVIDRLDDVCNGLTQLDR